MFDKLFQASLWRHDLLCLLAQSDLLPLQLIDPSLIGCDDRRAGRFDNPIQQGIGLLLNVPDLRHERCARAVRLRKPHVPDVDEHRPDQPIELLGGLQRPQEGFCAFLNVRARYRLAGRVAVLRIAKIIGVELLAPLRPTGGHRLAAVIADDEPAQREVFVDILSGGSVRVSAQPFLNTFVCGEADQRLVMPFPQRYAPFRGFDVSRVCRAFENLSDLGDTNITVRRGFRQIGLGFKEPHDLALRGKASSSVAFQRLCDDRGQGFVAHQQLAVHAISCVAIADWRVKDVVAFLDSRLHLLDHLTAVLFTLQLALRGEDRLDKLAFRRVIQLEVKALDPRAARLKLAPQLDMEFRITRKALQIIEDDNVIFIGLRIEIAQQRNHPRPLDEITAARGVVREDGLNLIALCRRILAAAVLLALKAAIVSHGVV